MIRSSASPSDRHGRAVNDKCCKLLEISLCKERHSDRMKPSGMNAGISTKVRAPSASLRYAQGDGKKVCHFKELNPVYLRLTITGLP